MRAVWSDYAFAQRYPGPHIPTAAISGGTEVSVLLTRPYAPSGDFAEPAYAARTSHWAASMTRSRTSGCAERFRDCGDNK